MPTDGFTIPENEYTVSVAEAKEGKSKNGDYQVTCELKVSGGDHDGFIDGLNHSPVLASCSGVAGTAEYSGTYGYHVIVDCGDGWVAPTL